MSEKESLFPDHLASLGGISEAAESLAGGSFGSAMRLAESSPLMDAARNMEKSPLMEAVRSLSASQFSADAIAGMRKFTAPSPGIFESIKALQEQTRGVRALSDAVAASRSIPVPNKALMDALQASEVRVQSSKAFRDMLASSRAARHAAGISDVAKMIKDSETTMAHRVAAGRRRLPDEEKAKPVGISLSTITRSVLDQMQTSTGKSRSEIIGDAVHLWNYCLGAALAAGHDASYSAADAIAELGFAGHDEAETTEKPLTETELQLASSMSSAALTAWISSGDRKQDEIASAMQNFFEAAVKTIRATR